MAQKRVKPLTDQEMTSFLMGLKRKHQISDGAAQDIATVMMSKGFADPPEPLTDTAVDQLKVASDHALKAAEHSASALAILNELTIGKGTKEEGEKGKQDG